MAATKGLNFKVSATAAGLSALSSFTKALSGIGSAGTVAKNSMLGMSSQMNSQVRAYDALKALSTSYAASLGQIDRAYRLNAISGDEWAAATGRAEAQFAKAKALFAESPGDAQSFLDKFATDLQNLTAKYNPATAASQRYDAAVVELNHALHLGALDANQYALNIQKIPGSLAAVVAENNRVTQSFKSAADAASVFDTEFNRLQAKFNPAAAAMQRMAQTEAELTRAMHLGVISVEQHAIQLKELQNTAQAAAAAQRQLIPATNALGTAIDTHNRSVGSWNRGLKDTNRAIQQAGFQVGDFFIQVAGGQSIVLAFTQQAGQLIQFFGMWGSLAAAAIAIGGALWMMFGQGENATKKAADALNAFNSALSNALDNVTIANTSVAELAKTYGQFADEVHRAAQESMSFDLSKSLSALRDGAMTATVSLAEVHQEMKLLQAMQADAMVPEIMTVDQLALVDGLAASLGVSAAQADALYLAVGKFNGGGTFAEMRDNAQSVVDMLGQMYAGSVSVPPEIQKMRDEYTKSLLVLDQIVAVQDGSAAAAREVTTAVVQSTNASAGLGTQLQNIGAWAREARNTMSESAARTREWSVNGQSLATTFKSIIPSITAVVTSIGNGTTAMRTMVNAQPGQGWLGTAMYRMDTLASKAWAAASAVASAMSGSVQSVGIGGAGRPEGIDIDPDARGAVMLARVQIMQKAAADAAAALGNVGGGGGGGGGAAPVEAITAQVTEATEALNEMKSVADSISGAFMSAFSGVLKGTKSVKDAAMDMLNTVLDKTIELLMAPVFDGIAGFIGKSIFGAVGSLGPVPSFAGGGSTGNTARSGGLDGKGGFLSIMHPKETVTDHTRAGGGTGGGGVTINVIVDGATGNGEIMEMVSRGVSVGLQHYDAKVLPQSLKRVSANPRRM